VAAGPDEDLQMTLRTRLMLFFVAIVVPPILAATIAFQALASRQAEVRTDTRLSDGARAVVSMWEDQHRIVQEQVRLAAQRVGLEVAAPSLPARVAALRDDVGLDLLVVAAPDGAVLAADLAPVDFGGGFERPGAAELSTTDHPATIATRVEVVAGDRSLVVTGGRYADSELAAELAEATSLAITIRADGVAIGSAGELAEGDPRSLRIPSSTRGAVVLRVVPPPGVPGWIWLVALAGLAVIVLLGLALAAVMARPIERLAEGARAVASGDLDARVEGGETGDIGHVADAFNTMTDYLRTYVGELRMSRDELRRGLDRMGATLRSTLDLGGMLEVVLDTAAVTLGARAGALYLLRGGELHPEVTRGHLAPANSGLAVGSGIAGRAAATGAPVLVGPAVAAPPVEPEVDTGVAVPLVRGDRTIGVIALYGRAGLDPFTEDDTQTLSSFAGQASVAIENVLLHQETRQLSITDGLTGVWNRRYLEMTLRKEIERAQRFGRPLAVLMLDIDRFKRVNDRFGHPRGDEVLVEVTRRLVAELRASIDVVGRYGGEEFVVILPETPVEGARVVAEKIRTAIRDEPFEGPGEVSITVSVGVSGFPEDGSSAEELIHAADDAMYRAKAAGRDRVESRPGG
jgi:diguanylate cyclase (GGDEF)-like protein